jgi:hypothetical protein
MLDEFIPKGHYCHCISLSSHGSPVSTYCDTKIAIPIRQHVVTSLSYRILSLQGRPSYAPNTFNP